MDSKFLEELRQKHIQNPPKGMTSKLVRTMSDSDLLDMHEFLTEDNDLDDDEFEKGFYINLFNHRLFTLPVFCVFFNWFTIWRTFLLYKKDQAKYFHLIFFKTLYISGYHPDNQLIKIYPVSINYLHFSPLPPLNKKHFPKTPKTVSHSPDIY